MDDNADDLFQDSGIDLDQVDLRSLAAQAKSEHLHLVVDEQRRRYTYLINKGLKEQDEARKEEAATTGVDKTYPYDDANMLILSLLSEWVDAVPEIDETSLAMELTPSGTIGTDKDILKRRKKNEKKKRKKDMKKELKFKHQLQSNEHSVAAGDNAFSKSLDDQVPMGVGLTPLLLATASEKHDSLSCMKTLLEAGADPNARQPLTLAAPLHLACLKSVQGNQNNRSETIRDKDDPAHTTSESKHATLTTKKKNKKQHKSTHKDAEKTTNNSNALTTTNNTNGDELLSLKIQMLVDFGADINGVDQANMTPLHAACLAGQSATIVALLLSNGADPNMQDNAVCVDSGWTPLHHLAAGISYDPRSTVKIGQTLLNYGADPSVRGRWIENMMGNHLKHRKNKAGHGNDPQTTAPVTLSEARARKPIWLAPDEIAYKLGKKHLFSLLSRIRCQIDEEETMFQKEKRNNGTDDVSMCTELHNGWNTLTPLFKKVLGMLVALVVLFWVFIGHNLPMMAGGIGACLCMNVLFLIVMKREQKWVDDANDSLEYRKKIKAEYRRLSRSKKDQ